MTTAGPEAIPVPAVAGDDAAVRTLRSGQDFAFHHPSVLGTRLSLLVHAADEVSAAAAELRATDAIRRLGRILNWRDPSSELSRLNRASAFTASPDLYAVVSAAENWRMRTANAFSGRLGRVLDLWRASGAETPDRALSARLAKAAMDARVDLDPATRTITRPDPVTFDLDAIAKGYIVDRAVAAAMDAPDVQGVLVDIGGDIRCAGRPASASHWTIGLPTPFGDTDNAPLAGAFHVRDAALATSGHGPAARAFAGGRMAGILDPRTGWPVPRQRSATVLAPATMDADALATAFAGLDESEAARIAAAMPEAAIRLAKPESETWLGAPPLSWRAVPVKDGPPPQGAAKGAAGWPDGWVVLATFTAPPRHMQQERAFRSPYVAIWASDEQNRPVRTLLLVGTIKEWQRDNFIWWSTNGEASSELLDIRSMSTRGSGVYKVLWDGQDDAGKPLPPGRYTIHVETSRERGRHTHRSVSLDITSPKAASAELEQNGESGGLSVSFETF